jgi:hypothetical protein
VGASVPVEDCIGALENIITHQAEKIAALESTQALQTENLFFMYNLLEAFLKKKPQPAQQTRGQVLKDLIAANGGQMLATKARKRMRMRRSTFSELLATVKDEIEARPYSRNKSWKVLILKASVQPNTE